MKHLAGLFAVLMLAVACGSTASTPPVVPDAYLGYSVVGADEGKVGPDGAKHDLFTATGPVTVHVGDVVSVSVVNNDDMPHSMVSPELGFSVMIAAGKEDSPATTTFTFKATKTCNSSQGCRWYCAMPCDTDNKMWDMDSTPNGPSRDGFMAGYIQVVQ